MGSDLYNHLIRYFNTHLVVLRDVRSFPCIVKVKKTETSTQTSEPLADEPLLRYYAGEWDRYTTGANYVNRLFTYLNRHWVKREKDEGRKGVYNVYTLSLVQWKSYLFEPVQSKNKKLASAVLRLIESQRNGQTIDSGLVKKVIDSFGLHLYMKIVSKSIFLKSVHHSSFIRIGRS
jgi:cullin 1